MSAAAPERQPIVARTPDDVISLVPHVIGFEPTESIVMLTFGAARPFHARVDLPRTLEGRLQVLGSLRQPCIDHNVARVMLLAYASHDYDEARAALAFMCESMDMTVEVIAGLVVSPCEYSDVNSDRWIERATEPTAAAVAAAVQGSAPRASRDEVVASVQPGDEPNDIVALLLTDPARYDERILGICQENAHSQVEYWTATAQMTSRGRGPRVCSLLALAAWLSGDGALAWSAVDRVRSEGSTVLADAVATFLEKAIAPEAWVAVRDEMLKGA